MNWRGTLVFLYFHLIGIGIWAQQPIGLKASSLIRGLPFGTAVSIENLRNHPYYGEFISYLKQNYQIIVPENDLKPHKLWRGENEYDWTDSD